jgi:hypothetical protein
LKIGRRTFMKAGVAMAAMPLPAYASTTPDVSLVVFDKLRPTSRYFAQQFGINARDVAQLHAENWATFRAPLPAGPIAGLTNWSDLVIARGYAEEQGRRLRFERQQGQLFEWQIA